MQQKQSNIKQKGNTKNKKLWAMTAMSINKHKWSQKHYKTLSRWGPGGVPLSKSYQRLQVICE
jgi:hypothetical protein